MYFRNGHSKYKQKLDLFPGNIISCYFW